MNPTSLSALCALASAVLLPTTSQTAAPPPTVRVQGERLPPSAIGPGRVESLDEVVKRDRANPAPDGVHFFGEPKNPNEEQVEEQKAEAAREGATGGSTSMLGGSATSPTIGTNFVGPREGDAGGGWIPPDTCGAVGLSHFVSIVNANVSVWAKSTGARLTNVGEASFFGSPNSLGDGRCVYDPSSNRFILIGDSFSSTSRIYLAVSATSDPTGAWFKTSFQTNTGGVDSGSWPDYPTLGVDANGIYIGVYAVNSTGNGMTIFAIDKAPLVAPTQTMGTVTAFRNLFWEGAIQPCVTFGNPGGEYLITYQQIYRIDPPLTSPNLVPLGNWNIPSFGAPPDAPNMGGSTLDTLDGRLMNAVFRNGRIWTTHAVNGGGRSCVRWYEVDPTQPAGSQRVQYGQIDDPTIHYFAPGIATNANGSMVVGFTGSSGAQFAAAYVSGRKPTDTTGQTCPPIQIKAGEASYNDGGSPSRWGDYALTTIDPANDIDFWSIVEYARSGNVWGTWIAKTIYDNCAPVVPTNFCTAAPNSYSVTGANMSFAGTNSISQNNFELDVYNVVPNKTCMFLYAEDQSAFVTFGNGFRCINSPIFRVKPATTSNLLGDVQYPLDLHSLPAAGAITAGSSWGFMLWYRDPAAGGALFNGSDGLSTTWCP